MSEPFSLRFESRLRAPRERIWTWITSVEGISREIWPFFRMTAPKGVRSLADVTLQPAMRIFRSHVFLFGVLPIDYSDMTLLELTPGVGFVEQSPMGSMKLWRHERYIAPCPHEPGVCLLVDQLTFQPRMAKHLVAGFIRRVFIHRHQVLRKALGAA
ncbi:hypothetical protein ACSVIJ_02370 [Pseudomonas sp. NCHU5208]|uniref:hypothetical protein n=1 Tax=unclassified Pseudomonas TaxID=196821 RepID=UPI003F957878